MRVSCGILSQWKKQNVNFAEILKTLFDMVKAKNGNMTKEELKTQRDLLLSDNKHLRAPDSLSAPKDCQTPAAPTKKRKKGKRLKKKKTSDKMNHDDDKMNDGDDELVQENDIQIDDCFTEMISIFN